MRHFRSGARFFGPVFTAQHNFNFDNTQDFRFRRRFRKDFTTTGFKNFTTDDF